MAARTSARTTRSATTKPNRPASIADGADYYQVSTRTIRRYVAQGLLPAYRIGPRLVRIDLDDLDRLARRIPTAGSGDAA